MSNFGLRDVAQYVCTLQLWVERRCAVCIYTLISKLAKSVEFFKLTYFFNIFILQFH